MQQLQLLATMLCMEARRNALTVTDCGLSTIENWVVAN